MTMADHPEDMCTPDAMPKLISFLSSLLHRVAESNHPSSAPQKISVFNGLSRPTISVHTYLQRILKYANCSPSCYIVAYVYLDRFTQRHPSIPINPFNVHRLLITSVMLSAKFMDDIYYNNAYYAKVGGISTAEMNFLEVDFLFGLGFHLNVSPSDFYRYCCYLQTEMIIVQPQIIIINSNGVDDSEDRSSEKSILLCFNREEESSARAHHQQQQQQQLAV